MILITTLLISPVDLRGLDDFQSQEKVTFESIDIREFGGSYSAKGYIKWSFSLTYPNPVEKGSTFLVGLHAQINEIKIPYNCRIPPCSEEELKNLAWSWFEKCDVKLVLNLANAIIEPEYASPIESEPDVYWSVYLPVKGIHQDISNKAIILRG